MKTPPGAAGPQVDYRHPWVVRLWHWANAGAVVVLLMTGLLLFDIHPRLYWGDDGHAGMPAFLAVDAMDVTSATPRFSLQLGGHHWDVTGIIGTIVDEGDSGKYVLIANPPDDWQFGATRGWHFMFAWLLGLSLPAYALYLLVSGRLRDRLLPTRVELSARSIGHELSQHLRMRRARGEASRHYNILQKASYLSVIGVLIPLAILSGFTMSNAMTAVFPGLIALFGGHQSARSVHFMVAMLLGLFLLVHVFQVLVSGFTNLMRSMITGRFVVEPEELP